MEEMMFNTILKIFNESKTDQPIEEKLQLKRVSMYWDEWSGSRYVRRENPIMKMSENEWRLSGYYNGKPKSELEFIDQITRSNPVTGEWSIL
jgi:hypothetical protein